MIMTHRTSKIGFLLLCLYGFGLAQTNNAQCPLHLDYEKVDTIGSPPQLVILVGPHKTGSSALQSDMSLCQQELSKFNWVVPSIFGYPAGIKGHSLLFEAIKNPVGSIVPSTWFWADTDPNANKNNLQARYQNRLKNTNLSKTNLISLAAKEIQDAYSNQKSVILASENFSLLNVSGIRKLYDLTRGASNITVVITYRNPLSHYRSWYAQNAKFEANPHPLSHYLFRDLNDSSNFMGTRIQNMINDYESVFGPKSAILISFDGARNAGYDLMDLVVTNILKIPTKSRLLDKEVRQTNQIYNTEIYLRIVCNKYLRVKNCSGFCDAKSSHVLERVFVNVSLPWDCSEMRFLNEVLLQRDRETLLAKYRDRMICGDRADQPYDKEAEWCELDETKFLERREHVLKLASAVAQIPSVSCPKHAG
jgi:hypothetical protein